MAEYDSQQLEAAGDALAELIIALADGVDANDVPEGVAFLVAVTNCINEISEDTDAALLGLLGACATRYSEIKRGL